MAERDEIISFCDELLESDRFEDYGPNGLQVPGGAQVETIATGVSANLAFLEAAVGSGAQLVLVHHGLFWGSEVSPLSTPMGGPAARAPLRRGLAGRVPTCPSTPTARSATTPCSATSSVSPLMPGRSARRRAGRSA